MITTAAIATEVRRLADEGPERKARCVYVNPQREPVCIVGHALVNLGYDADQLFRYSGGWINGLVSAGWLPDIEDTGELMWLRTVQESQDDGVTWGVAVDIADEVLDKRR